MQEGVYAALVQAAGVGCLSARDSSGNTGTDSRYWPRLRTAVNGAGSLRLDTALPTAQPALDDVPDVGARLVQNDLSQDVGDA